MFQVIRHGIQVNFCLNPAVHIHDNCVPSFCAVFKSSPALCIMSLAKSAAFPILSAAGHRLPVKVYPKTGCLFRRISLRQQSQKNAC